LKCVLYLLGVEPPRPRLEAIRTVDFFFPDIAAWILMSRIARLRIASKFWSTIAMISVRIFSA
jgi:hypothetical protein